VGHRHLAEPVTGPSGPGGLEVSATDEAVQAFK
jgi:hypothetical protein